MPRINFEWRLDINTILVLLTIGGTVAVWDFRLGRVETTMHEVVQEIRQNERNHSVTHDRMMQLINDTVRALAVVTERVNMLQK